MVLLYGLSKSSRTVPRSVKTTCQHESAAVLAGETAQKDLPDIDYVRALRILRSGAEADSPDPNYYGRYAQSYRARGYVGAETPQCVLRHLEYCYQDWCLAQLARKAGDEAAAERFAATAGNLWTLWRDDVRAFAPRKNNGDWHEPFNPDLARRDVWNDPFFYEGSGREWAWSAHQDFPELVARMGGAQAFRRQLDDFFAPAGSPVACADDSLAPFTRYRSKETLLHVPYLYHYCGLPELSTVRVRDALSRFFSVRRDGLHDNEDMGCQSAFYIASALGLYPLCGQDLYWLTTPLFTRSEIQLAGAGKTLTIVAPQLTEECKYIVGARLNGKDLNRAWVRHGEIAGGGVIEYDLAATPRQWGHAVADIS